MAVQPAPTTGNAQMPGLLRLPLELRIKIYRHLIPTKRIIDASRPRFNYTISNRRTRGVGVEGIDIEEDSCDVDDGEQIRSDIVTLDNDSESGLSEDPHNTDVVDFGGCTDSIYAIVLDQATAAWDTDWKKNSIFLVCKQISNEALDVLYGENAFRQSLHGDGGLCLKQNFTEANRRRMRMLLLTVEHRSWIGELTPDKELWSSIIPTLHILRLVAGQPVQETYYNAPPLAQTMQSWFKFLRTFLNCFRQLLNGKSLEVDFDGNKETGEVVKECMLGRYREVRCRFSGDLMFRRGRFSYSSGYWDDDDNYGFGSWDV